MNFAIWLLKRMKRKLIGNFPSKFIKGYREFLQAEFAGCLVITLLIGSAQFILGAMFFAWIWDGSPPKYMLYILLANPVIFFVYNWLAVLYGYYTSEKMATWHRLKE